MSDIRFYGEGKTHDVRQVFLSEDGVFYYGTRKELIEYYRLFYPRNHLMVYLYSRTEYDKNMAKELYNKDPETYKSTPYNHFQKLKLDNYNLMFSTGVSLFDPAEERRKLGFDFEKDNGIER